MITAEHVRAARAILAMPVREFAKATELNSNTICRVELGGEFTRVTERKIHDYLVAQGFDFYAAGLSWSRRAALPEAQKQAAAQ